MRWWITAIAVFVCTQVWAAEVTAKSWLVADTAGKPLSGIDIDTVRPIASISKLLTVIVVLDAKQNMSAELALSKVHLGYLPNDEFYTRRALIKMAMVRSDNQAAQTLCEAYPNGYDACMAAINAKAAALGMRSTHLEDPTGLDMRNVSTARDLALLVAVAMHYPEIVDASGDHTVTVATKHGALTYPNTDPLAGKIKDITVSKTGFTNPAGGCIVIGTRSRIVVLLASKSVHTRIPEANQLLQQVF